MIGAELRVRGRARQGEGRAIGRRRRRREHCGREPVVAGKGDAVNGHRGAVPETHGSACVIDIEVACTGAASYIVFLFRDRGLFRISWRLLADDQCPSTRAAAEEIYARYLAVDGTTSLASHYQAGKAEVVEVTDPRVDYLIPYRWANRQRR